MRDPYPQYEPMAFDPIDAEVSTGKALARGLLLIGVLLLVVPFIWL